MNPWEEPIEVRIALAQEHVMRKIVQARGEAPASLAGPDTVTPHDGRDSR